MKGMILVFNDQKQVGAITTTSGQRYLFPIRDWTEDLAAPERGLMVEFDADENNRARNVRLAQPEVAVTQAVHAPVEVVPVERIYQPKRKKKSVLTLLCIFLGPYGAHKFYIGAWGWGIVYILALMFVSVLATIHPLFAIFLMALAVFVMVEWIRYILMSDAQFDAKMQTYQASRPGPFSFFW